MNARKKWLMKHPIQVKYLLIVILAMLAPTLLIGFCLYHLVFALLARQMVFPEAILSNLVPVVERVNGFLIFSLPLLALAILAIGLVVSHRFAGPIERMESELDRVLAGDRQRRIRMREDDDLKGVAHRINALLEQIGQ